MKNSLPFDAVIFDLDGVITKTALVHSAAWKEMFDTYLKQREEKYNEPFKEFTHENDYLKYVDGKPRYEGVKSFLESRGISIPFGIPDDKETEETCCGVGNLKNIYFNRILDRDGIQLYQSTVDLMHELIANGVSIGVASSSKNCESVLKTSGLIDLVQTRVDGVVSAQLGLKGKPEADIFTTAADNLNAKYSRSIVVEDAISGVQAGKKGNFGLVLGLAREDNDAELKANGADIVISDISEISLNTLVNWFEIGLEEDGWSINYFDYNPENERSREALLSVGNGYFGTRGAMEETAANKINYPGTYMAGVFNRLTSKVSDRNIENEDFVNVINWLPITFKIDNDTWFDINNTKILSIERKLDFKSGLLLKVLKIEDNQGRQTNIYTRRFAAMHNSNLAGIHYCIQPVNYSGKISYKSQLDGAHINAGVARYAALNQRHLQPYSQKGSDNFQEVTVKTTESNIHITALSRLELLFNGEIQSVDYNHYTTDGIVESVCSVDLKQGDYLGLMKTVFLKNYKTASEAPVSTNVFNAINAFEDEFEKSKNAWEKIWNKIDVKISGDRLSQKLVRMHLYHLMSGTSENNVNIDFGIPARGLTGEAYRGHIFWDELYILPFYFIHYPDVAKAVLMYRYNRLNEAKKYAIEFGYNGAMYPWQSGSDGREETQKYHFNPISGEWGDDHSSLQRHVSMAIAYNILQYFNFSTDIDFMKNYGLEMLLEINLFWLSKCNYDIQTDKYYIDKVMGPDEFHEGYPGAEEGGLKNNAYTNIMTIWMFEETKKVLALIDNLQIEKLFKKTNFSERDLELMAKISKSLSLDISEDGIIAQYEGYFNLKELDWDFYKKKYGNVHRMDRVLKAEGLSPDAYKVAKQADTLMTFYNLNNQRVTQIINQLGYKIPEDYIQKNLDYYLQRTSHGSTLSRVVHAYLASQLGDYSLSWSMYNEAIQSDYNDIQGGTTAEGVHTGVMAGTIWIIISTFAGIEFDSILKINPQLPKHWDEIEFGLVYKKITYKFKVSHNSILIKSDKNSKIVIQKQVFQLIENENLDISLI